MNILVIEDEPNVISLLQRGFTNYGYNVSVAMDGDSGLKMAINHNFDAIILDLMLPGKNGMQVCNEFRKKNQHTPILMLTALNTTENIVSGLEGGADDYMTKPFKIAELEARIRTIIRRRNLGKEEQESDTVFQIADLSLNDSAKVVIRNGNTITLTATEFRLLHFLLKNKNRVLSRMEILENVWDIDFNLGTNVVDVYINYLRKKIDNGQSVKLLHTVFGMGYILKEGYEN